MSDYIFSTSQQVTFPAHGDRRGPDPAAIIIGPAFILRAAPAEYANQWLVPDYHLQFYQEVHYSKINL
jgi:hypothetical protein